VLPCPVMSPTGAKIVEIVASMLAWLRRINRPLRHGTG
jgi:hypothetical protein